MADKERNTGRIQVDLLFTMPAQLVASRRGVGLLVSSRFKGKIKKIYTKVLLEKEAFISVSHYFYWPTRFLVQEKVDFIRFYGGCHAGHFVTSEMTLSILPVLFSACQGSQILNEAGCHI